VIETPKNERKREPEPPAQNCTNCRYSGDKNGMLMCRRNPPVAALIMGMNPLDRQPVPSSVSLWAPVDKFDWCSQHAVKLKEIN
jgi:hypothetical protein